MPWLSLQEPSFSHLLKFANLWIECTLSKTNQVNPTLLPQWLVKGISLMTSSTYYSLGTLNT